jgi:endonuclease/exonuclease/phosphatase family metal-dependent hydrolase
MIDDSQSLNLVEGLYYFDQSVQQWSECPHIPLTSDDPMIPSSSETWLPERCHFVTWNILFDYYQSTLIHSQQRYQGILNTLKSVLPDIICLQEVTKTFLNLLLNQLWFQQNNYYLIIMKSIFNTDEQKSYGQLMIMKNFRPRSFSICPLDLEEDENGKLATTRKPKITKELIIARFGLSDEVTIDLVNLHLHSDLARNSTEKRCQTLNNLFRTMKTHNYMLIGDFNFGDALSKEQNILTTYQNEIHDLWKQVYRLDQVRHFYFIDKRSLTLCI